MSEDEIVAAIDGAAVLKFPARKKKARASARPRAANDAGHEPPLDDGGFDMAEMNEQRALVMLGSKAVMMRLRPDAPIKDRIRFVSVEAFRELYANRWTERRSVVDGKLKYVTFADAFRRSPERRTYQGVEFVPDPGEPPGTWAYFNFWQGFSVTPGRTEGASYSIFRDHLLTNVANGDQALFTWIFAWFAQMLQMPRERIGNAIVLRGGRGSGKTKVGQVFGSLIKDHYFLVDEPRYIVGQFNAHLASCLLLQADEGFWAGDKAAEGRLKGLITAEHQMIESKGIDAIQVANYVRLLITSNEDWVIPAGRDERRFLVCDVGEHVAQNHGYFREMEEQLDAGGREALLADLLAFDLDTVDLRVIPKTEALLQQKLRTLDHIEAWWFERLESGSIKQGIDCWEDIGVDDLYGDYIAWGDRIGVKRKAEKQAWSHKLHRLAPQLGKKRVSRDGFSRRPTYQVPSLKEARSDFEIYVQQRVAWPEDDLVTVNEGGHAGWRAPDFDFSERD